MTGLLKVILAAAIAVAAVVVGGANYAAAAIQARTAAELRATGLAGEQFNGYMGVVGDAPTDVRARVNSINITRRAAYTEIAGRRRVKIEDVGAAMACEIFATSILPGQYYMLSDGIWRQRQGNASVPRPSYCG
jgi:uncharacterized protein